MLALLVFFVIEWARFAAALLVGMFATWLYYRDDHSFDLGLVKEIVLFLVVATLQTVVFIGLILLVGSANRQVLKAAYIVTGIICIGLYKLTHLHSQETSQLTWLAFADVVAAVIIGMIIH